MKFEKLNENKLRITLTLSDLAQNNIDYQSFMSNSADTQKLFSDMLIKAEKEMGFVTQNYKIMIEALVTSKGDFIVTITRYLPSEGSPLRKKNLSVKRKYTSTISNHLMYLFNTFDDYCRFCNSLDVEILNNLNKISKHMSLYTYNGRYFFLLNEVVDDKKYTLPFVSAISEFSTLVRNSNIMEFKLKEYGKIIIKNNAIKTCLKYFG